MDRGGNTVSGDAAPADARELLEATIGYRFRDAGLLTLALTHPSYAYESDQSRGNERLEFLGDAVLDVAVADALFAAHPDWDEGLLTRVRASLVNTEALAGRARSLGLGAHLLLGRTEVRASGADKDSILACALEAVIGALYLDGGLGPAKEWIAKLFAESFAAAEPPPADPKTRFQEWAHAMLHATPSYATLRDNGRENAEDRFTVEVRVAGRLYARGRGRTKRAAERSAALEALVDVLDVGQ
jgi:ribonuclease III